MFQLSTVLNGEALIRGQRRIEAVLNRVNRVSLPSCGAGLAPATSPCNKLQGEGGGGSTTCELAIIEFKPV